MQKPKPSPKQSAPDREKLKDEYIALADQIDLVTEVFSDGPTNATVAIIGEGPGETELRQRSPFVGGSGKLLWDSLRRYGIHRANAYVTNVVKRQISLNRRGNEKNIVHRPELDKWIGLARWELAQLPNVRVILCLGNYALEALSSHQGVTDWRGSVIPMELPNGAQGHIVITINPAYAMRELKYEPIFQMDCNKLHMVATNRWKPYQIETLINPTYAQSMAWLIEIKKGRKATAHDLESTNGETACIGLANDAHSSICINFRGEKGNRFSIQEEADIRIAYQDLCDSHRDWRVPAIAQNGNFDTYWLRLKDHLCTSFSDDTMLQHFTLYPQLPHNLGFLCAQYTTHPFYKDEGKTWREGGDIDQYWRYNGKDTCITLACWIRMNAELKAQGLYDFYRNHMMRAQPHLSSATNHGLGVDLERKKDIVAIVGEEVNSILHNFWRLVEEATGDPDYRPNPGSWQQMQELYFRRLHLRGRGFSTDENNRLHMLKNPENSAIGKEILTVVGRYAEERKFLGTYAESRVGLDGRFRCEYKQTGVSKAPGRLSSASLLTGEGGNLQNQPERAKEMYTADPGCVFLYFDLAQAEARVVAWRANIPSWKQQFEQARIDGVYDCHRALAAEMFKLPYDEVPTKDWVQDKGTGNLIPTIRYVSKRCRHGLNYRMERFRLSEVTQLPYHEAARAFTLYHRITPELEKWWRQAESDFKLKREAWNPFGRRWKVIQRIDEEVLKSVVAFYPQSTVGDKVTRVWYQAEEDDEWPMDARVCLNVHDSLTAMVVASPKTIKTAAKILKRYAEEPIFIQDAWNKFKPEPLIIPADLKVSYPCEYNAKERKYVKSSNTKMPHRWSNMETLKL